MTTLWSVMLFLIPVVKAHQCAASQNVCGKGICILEGELYHIWPH